MAYKAYIRDSIVLRADLIPCAHHCRYCCISSNSRHGLAKLTLERFFALADRLDDWCASSGFSFFPTAHNSDDITKEVAAFLDETIASAHDAAVKSPHAGRSKFRLGTVRTGGIRFRSNAEIRTWLSRWRDSGSTTVHGSFAGYEKSHDWWNNREGDYDFLIRIQKIAADMGFAISQTIFLMKNTLPGLERLLDDLDRLPTAHVSRVSIPIAYLGRARSEQAERFRLTEEDRIRVHEAGLVLHPRGVTLASERERIATLEDEEPAKFGLIVRATDDNIERLERSTPEEIVATLLKKVQAAYRAVPSREELGQRYGNPDGRKIYGSFEDVERKWFDRFLSAHNLTFEPELTHLF